MDDVRGDFLTYLYHWILIVTLLLYTFYSVQFIPFKVAVEKG